MLAPEIWHLPLPASKNIILRDLEKIRNLVRRQHFNHSIMLAIPESLCAPEAIEKTLSLDTEYYYIAQLPLTELINLQFINLFVRSGTMNLHSVQTRLDLDNCIAIDPRGILLMSLNREVFYGLGLEGKKSKFSNNKFVVKLDLKSAMFSYGSKRLKKLRDRIKTMRNMSFDVVCAWEPHDDQLCPSSLAYWFSQAGFYVHCCKNEKDQTTICDVRMPHYSNDPWEIQEWVGMLRLGCEWSPKHFAISSYTEPSLHENIGQLSIVQWTGFFTSARITEALELLIKWTEERNSSTWTMISVIGMDDSVTVPGDDEHNYFFEGSYSTTVFLRTGDLPTALYNATSAKAPKGRKRKLK